MRVILRKFSHIWRDTLRVSVILIIVTLPFVFQLSSLVPVLIPVEAEAFNASSSIQKIIDNPLFAPHKLLQLGLRNLHLSDTLSARIPSVLFAVTVVLLFLGLARRLHTRRISLLGSGLFLGTTWLISLGRTGTPTVMYLSWFLVIAVLLWFRYSRQTILAPFLLPLLCVSAVYTPGTILFVIVMLLWYWRDMPKVFQFMSKGGTAFGVLTATLLSLPLVYAFVNDPSLIRDWLLIPDKVPAFGQILSNLNSFPGAYLYRFNPGAGLWLSKLPVLDIFAGTMFLLGLYYYRNKLKMDRTMVLIITAVVACAIAMLQPTYIAVTFVLPFVYLIVCAGIGFLLQQWFTVFPKNPIARNIGVSLISVCVLMAGYYHINRYFIAWVHAPPTKAIYQKAP